LLLLLQCILLVEVLLLQQGRQGLARRQHWRHSLHAMYPQPQQQLLLLGRVRCTRGLACP
jgi:hypothetical protein